ncbi:MAG: hypothetical protein IIC75_01805 [Bacteroidetes bacterium]|nr:hypothetical protein [Bacteroidota bacterium]
MNENQNNQIPQQQNSYSDYEDNRPFEERFKETVTKWRPYLLRLWEAKWKFVIINVMVLVLTLTNLLFFTHPYYKSTVTILPDYGNKSGGMLSQLSGLASLAGISVGKGASTEIYQNLLTSESVIRPVVYAKYNTEEYDHPVNLIEYFKLEPDESLPNKLQKRQMFLTLYNSLTKGIISNDVERMTKILTVTAQMPEAQLSADVVNNLVESLNNYVLTQMKSFASEQRKYLDKRIAQVKDSLKVGENNLKNFREQNRVVLQSPQLMLEQARLARTITIIQTVYIELMKHYELVKLEEVRDTPILNIRELAKNPIKKAGPKRRLTFYLYMFFSILLSGTFFIFFPNIKNYYKIIRTTNKV